MWMTFPRICRQCRADGVAQVEVEDEFLNAEVLHKRGCVWAERHIDPVEGEEIVVLSPTDNRRGGTVTHRRADYDSSVHFE